MHWPPILATPLARPSSAPGIPPLLPPGHPVAPSGRARSVEHARHANPRPFLRNGPTAQAISRPGAEADIPRARNLNLLRSVWHEGPAKPTVLVPARLWFCLAVRLQTQELLYVVTHGPHRHPQAGPPVLAATKYNSALCSETGRACHGTCSPAPRAPRPVGQVPRQSLCILHARPNSASSVSWARARGRGRRWSISFRGLTEPANGV